MSRSFQTRDVQTLARTVRSSSALLYDVNDVHRDCLQGLLGMGSSGRPHRLLHSSWALRALVQVHGWFTSTGTIRMIRDGEARTATSTFTQLLGSEETMNHAVVFISA